MASERMSVRRFQDVVLVFRNKTLLNVTISEFSSSVNKVSRFVLSSFTLIDWDRVSPWQAQSTLLIMID